MSKAKTVVYIFAVTNVISPTAGLFLKYKNQMVRNSNPEIACYGDTISTSRDLKCLFFPAQTLRHQ